MYKTMNDLSLCFDKEVLYAMYIEEKIQQSLFWKILLKIQRYILIIVTLVVVFVLEGSFSLDIFFISILWVMTKLY